MRFSFVALDDEAIAQLDDAIPVGRVLIRVRDLNDRRAFARSAS